MLKRQQNAARVVSCALQELARLTTAAASAHRSSVCSTTAARAMNEWPETAVAGAAPAVQELLLLAATKHRDPLHGSQT
jgi:hypothetical protein